MHIKGNGSNKDTDGTGGGGTGGGGTGGGGSGGGGTGGGTGGGGHADEFCEGINSTASAAGWRDVSCVETKCAADLCNGLECFQPERRCLRNLTRRGEATLRNVAGSRIVR